MIVPAGAILPPVPLPGRRSGLALAAEIGAALFEEGPRSLSRFLALVVQRQRLEAERADAANVFAVGVERALGDRDRGRRQREDLAAPGLDFGVELLGRDDLIDEPHLVRLGGRVAPAQEPDLARPLLADQPRQIGGAPAGIDRAHPGADLAELRLLR